MDGIGGLAGEVGHEVIEPIAQAEHVLGFDAKIGGGALEDAADQRLMEHNLRVGQDVTLALGAGGQQTCPHAGGHADAGRRDIAAEIAHGVDHPEAGRDAAAGGVNVELDVALWIVVGKEEHLGDDDVGHFIGDRPADHDDAVFEKARVDVVSAFTAAGFFDDDGDQVVVFHMIQLSVVSCPLLGARRFGARCLRGRGKTGFCRRRSTSR